MLEHALALAEAGYAIFPLRRGTKDGQLTAHGVRDASKDSEQITKWWTTHPDANIAIAMGRVSGICGIDVDYKDGADPNFMTRIPPTVAERTPSGGMHPYFKYPDGGIRNNKKIEQGVTVRSDGYYFVVSPSTFGEKGKYEWIGRGLSDGEVADCPQWIVDHPGLKSKKAEDAKQGERHDTLVKKATYWRKCGKEQDWVLKKLFSINEKFKDGAKPVTELNSIVEWVWKTVDVEENQVGNFNGKIEMSEEGISEMARKILDIRFKLVVNEESSIIYNIKNIEKKEVTICNNEEYLLRRLHQNIIEEIQMTPTENFLKKVFCAWKMSTEPIRQPLPFCWKNQDEWTFKKLDFEPCPGNFDSWTEFLLRLSSPEDFMAFVWSIFEIKSRSRQYLYLFDPKGQGGKSTVVSVLGDILGNAYAAINNSFVNSDAARWLIGGLFGKRLVGWPDCKNTKFCMSELLRNITSGDDVTVEFKGKQPFTTKMYVKFILASNHEPSITSGGADLSRLIRIDVGENNSKNDPDWRDRLVMELPHFLHECKSWYERKCRNHGNILLSDATHELGHGSTGEVEAKFESIADEYLTFGDGFEATITQWVALCEKVKLSNIEISNFKDWLRQCHRCLIKKSMINGIRANRCFGFKINERAMSTYKMGEKR